MLSFPRVEVSSRICGRRSLWCLSIWRTEAQLAHRKARKAASAQTMIEFVEWTTKQFLHCHKTIHRTLTYTYVWKRHFCQLLLLMSKPGAQQDARLKKSKPYTVQRSNWRIHAASFHCALVIVTASRRLIWRRVLPQYCNMLMMSFYKWHTLVWCCTLKTDTTYVSR